MLILLAIVFGTIYIVFKPNLNSRFSSKINPILSAVFGVKSIGAFDSIVASCCGITLYYVCRRLGTIQRNTE